MDILSTPPKDISTIHSTNHCFDMSSWDFISLSLGLGPGGTGETLSPGSAAQSSFAAGPARRGPCLPGIGVSYFPDSLMTINCITGLGNH